MRPLVPALALPALLALHVASVPLHAQATGDQARLIFEKMLGYANHLGLFAEQTGSHGEAPRSTWRRSRWSCTRRSFWSGSRRR